MTQLRFGDGVYKSQGVLSMRIPTPNGSFIRHCFDVVQAQIPMLIGLDLLEKPGCYANNISNKLKCPSQSWTKPITRKFGHLYICWSNKEVLLTKNELVKMHKHFSIRVRRSL